MGIQSKLARLQTEVCRTDFAARVGLSTSDYTRFVILGMGRTGSNLLATSLRSHPDVLCYGELFNNAQMGKRVDWGVDGHRSTQALAQLREEDTAQFIDRYLFGKKPLNVAAVGFKLFYYHATEGSTAEIWNRIESDNIKVIHLRRKNLLETHLSMSKALSDRNWSTLSRKKGGPESSTVELSYDELDASFTQIREWEAEFARRFPESFDLSYEDLVADYGGHMRKVSEFLGLEWFPMATPLRKQSSRPVWEKIANYDELARQFAGTHWAGFFPDPQTQKR